MIRIVWTLSLALFLATGCKPKVAEMVREFVATEPHFQGSNLVIVDRVDGSFVDAYPEGDEGNNACDGNRCKIDDQETTLEALLGAEGFDFLETRRGVHLGESSIQHFEGEIFGYGGWLGNSAFAVLSGVLRDGTPGERGYAEEQIVHSYSVGRRSSTNPVSGAASWNGVMVGADVVPGKTVGDFIRGDATITVDFTDVDVDVLLFNIKNRKTGGSHPDLKWTNIRLHAGAFESGRHLASYIYAHDEEAPPISDISHIVGHFYGSDHEEVGGVFTRNGLHGAFGAKR